MNYQIDFVTLITAIANLLPMHRIGCLSPSKVCGWPKPRLTYANRKKNVKIRGFITYASASMVSYCSLLDEEAALTVLTPPTAMQEIKDNYVLSVVKLPHYPLRKA